LKFDPSNQYSRGGLYGKQRRLIEASARTPEEFALDAHIEAERKRKRRALLRRLLRRS
jgi:hypothetical protein